MGILFSCYKQKMRRGLWSPEEDEKLRSYITQHGHECWSSVPRLAGLKRCGRSCRLRWINHLSPDLNRRASAPVGQNPRITQHDHGCRLHRCRKSCRLGGVNPNPSITALAVFALFVSVLISLSLFLHRDVSSPSFSRPPLQHHQVFINFRGEDLRYSFLSFLEEDLERHGIKFFTDRQEERGKDLVTLFERIEESSIALAILSRRYAESGWCLEELVKIVERVEMGTLRVIPVFFKVEPSDVKKQTGDFGETFWGLAKTSRGEQIKKWKDALEYVSSKMGLTLAEKSYERDFAKEIVKEVERALAAIQSEEVLGNRSLDLSENNTPNAMYDTPYSS